MQEIAFPVGVHLGVVMLGVTCTWHGEFSRDAVLIGHAYTKSETTPWSIPRLSKSRQVGKNTIVQVMKNCLVERITRKNHC